MPRLNRQLLIAFSCFLTTLLFFVIPSSALKARWIPNGKKPAPFSKRYRDKHGIKSGEGTYGEPDPPPSNVKMLVFFAICVVIWWYFTRKPSGTSRSSSSRPTLSSSSRASADSTSSSRVSRSPSDAATMREARLRALQNRQKNMDEALAAASQNGGGSGRGSSGINSAPKPSSSGKLRTGGVHGLHTIAREGEAHRGRDGKKKGSSMSDATADDRARLIFPEDSKED